MSEKTAKDPYDLIVNDSATLFLSPTLFSLYSAHAAKEPFCTGDEESSSYKFVPRMRSVPKSDKPNRRRGQRGGRPSLREVLVPSVIALFVVTTVQKQ